MYQLHQPKLIYINLISKDKLNKFPNQLIIDNFKMDFTDGLIDYQE